MMRHTRRAPSGDGGGDLRHPGWDTINDLADGRLDAAREDMVRAHLGRCASCRATIDELQRLRAMAAALPPSLELPDGLWDDVAASIAGAGQAAGPRGAIGPTTADDASRRSAPPSVLPDSYSGAAATITASVGGARAGRRLPVGWLAAAAVVLMALSSGLTALYLRRDGDAAVRVARDAGGARRDPGGAATAALPAALGATESAYLANVAELEALLEAQRGALAPSTIAVVETALATIDEAIAEARAALLADPANQELAERLGANYRQKVELLRRAAEFPHAL